MKKLVYLLLLVFVLPSCVKDEDKAPDTTGLPKRIKTAIFFDHNVESQRFDYYYYIDKLVKAELYAKTGASGDWEMVNELNYEYDLPNVTLTVNYNWMGTWTETAKIEYIIEDGKIQEMNDYTNFYDVWRHDVSTSYSYANDKLISYVQENLRSDTVSYAKKYEYDYIDGFPVQAKQYYLLNGDWEMNNFYNYDYLVGGSGGYKISGFDADSIAHSETLVTTVGGLVTKRETLLSSSAGESLVLDKTETYRYFQEVYLLYSDLQTDIQFQHVDYYYENAEGNATWFNSPQEEIEGIPRPKGHELVNMSLNLIQKR